MEALILILAIAIVVGFIIFKSTSEEALEVLDKAKNQKPVEVKKVATKAPRKPQPVKATEPKKPTPTKTKVAATATKPTATTKPTGRKKKV